MKRYEKLGFVPSENFEGMVRRNDRRIKKYEAMLLSQGSPQQFPRQRCIDAHIKAAVFHHLEFGSVKNIKEHLQLASAGMLEYFLGDWWQNTEQDRMVMDKNCDKADLIWLQPYRSGATAAALLNRWDDLVRVGAWFDDRVVGEYQAELTSSSFSGVWSSIAASFAGKDARRSYQDDSLNDLDDERTRNLGDLWVAAGEKNQEVFDDALSRSIAHFVRTDLGHGDNPLYLVSLDCSFMSLVAQKNGLNLPELGLKEDSVLLRAETIGLS